MSKKVNQVVFICVVIALMPVGVMGKPFYIGGSYGWSDIDTGISSLTGSANLDENDDGFKFFIGTDINKVLSVEVHYANLGEATVTGGSSGGTYAQNGIGGFTIPANNRLTIEETSLGLSAIVRVPGEGKIKPYGRIGVHAWEQNTSTSYTTGLIDDDGIDIFGGLGVQVDINDRVSARAEYERYVYDYDGDDTDFFSIGLAIKMNRIRDLVMPTW